MDTAKVLKRHCGVCGVEYEVKKYDADRGRGKFCSPKCSNQNKTKATAKHTAESGTAKTHCEISSDVIAEIQVEVDGIFPWKGKQGVCDKMTVELGVKELQVDINGKVVCFPVCTALNLVEGVCKVCGRDMGKYFNKQTYAPHEKRDKDYAIYYPEGTLEAEDKFNNAVRDGKKHWVLNSEEEFIGKKLLLEKLVDKLDRKLMGQQARNRYKERGEE